MNKRLAAVLLGLAAIAARPAAEPVGPEAIDARRNRVNTAAMITLGSWAFANIGTGGVLSFTTDGSARHFHEMNAIWNTVNLALAGFGLAGSLRAEPSPDLFAAIEAQHRLEKTLLFNAGLDVGYIMAGLYLTELARRKPDQSDRLEGYGWSLVLQGGFLFSFDLVAYLLQRRSRTLVRRALAPAADQVY
ncbi:MAG: hypothetical protein JW820_00920 [Spirochaetales bacterium]|nr:hypothetical protein [Spirochaetales bacterium]